MADQPRYRITRASFDLVSVYGCLGATGVPGPVFAAVLAERGYSPSTVRNQVTRLVHRGVLLRFTQGRTSVYRLGPVAREQFGRLRDHGRESEFTGSFWAALHHIPESERGLRDRIAYLATHQGYRQLRPGVLIAVHDAEDELRTALVDHGGPALAERVDLCRLTPSDLGQARRWAATAWETAALRETVAAEETAVNLLESDESASESAFFDRFHTVSMMGMRTPELPEGLVPGLRAHTRLWSLHGRLLSLYRARYVQRVFERALAVPAVSLIEYDEEFWRRHAVTPPSPEASGQPCR